MRSRLDVTAPRKHGDTQPEGDDVGQRTESTAARMSGTSLRVV
jgi:hypothetical protein